MKNKKYLILTSGEYSDYSVDFLELPENCSLTQKEILLLINVDRWDAYEVNGEIIGELIGWEPMVLQTRAKYEIDSMFCCFDSRPVKTVLDKKHTMEELLEIANKNDDSGYEFWKREVAHKYEKYTKAFDLYHKLIYSLKG